MKALIVAPSWIGDTVLAQPLFRRLHERTPGLQLDALAPRWVAPVLERMPEITQLVDSPFAHGESVAASTSSPGAPTGGGRLPAGLRPAQFTEISAGAVLRRHSRTHRLCRRKRYGLINQRHTLDKTLLPQMAERFAQLAETPGAPLPRPLPLPRLTSSREQGAATRAELAIDRPEKLAVFCPGAEYGPAKRWPARISRPWPMPWHHVATPSGCSARPRTGRSARTSSAAPIAARLPLNFCGATSLRQAIDLLAAASFVVCNDSGLMHVAAALGRPLIASMARRHPASRRRCRSRPGSSACISNAARASSANARWVISTASTRLEPQRVLDACLRFPGQVSG
ncbi:MAG: lipopolysaccharide heptosyltransferase II [Candidatus Accumulibacter delftensis]